MSGITITRIGSGGDGVAESEAGPVYVPFALPGETYTRTAAGDGQRVGAASEMRIEPVCRHFGSCGGCIAQHMRADLYEDWKRSIVAGAFRAQGLAVPELTFRSVPPGTRRRAVLSAAWHREGVVLGYHRMGSHDLIVLEECPVLVPDLARRLPAFAAVAQAIFATMSMKARAGGLRLNVAALGAAVDVGIQGDGIVLDAAARARLATLSETHGLQRVSVGADEVVLRGAPALATAGGEIVPPPSAFFQAVAEAERAMADAIVAALGKAKTVADLFAGIGTFSLPMAKRVRVTAVDSDRAALIALSNASKRAQGLKPITTLHRDLFRDPLSPMELKDYDAVVLDPPRAGAKGQAEALSKSKIGTIVMVSCNPQTLARDAAILEEGGYKTSGLLLVDQFLWSAHVECVGVYRR